MKPGHRLLGPSRLLAVVGCIAFGAILGSSGTAHAASVQQTASIPADGSSVPVSPPAISVSFDQAIGSATSVVIACNGNIAPEPGALLGADGRSIVVTLSSPLPKGTCRVAWVVAATTTAGTSSGNFSFHILADTVTTTAGATGSGGSSTTKTTGTGTTAGTGKPSNVGGPLWLFRFLSTMTITVLFGGLVLITVAWPEGVEYILTIRFLRYTWVLAVLSTVLMVVCLTAQAKGQGFTASLGPTGWLDLDKVRPAGLAVLARLGLIVAAGWVAMRPERVIDPATQLPALAVSALAVATMGFSRSGGSLELVGYAAGVGHALAVAVWFGGLVLLSRVVLAGPGEDDLVHAVRGFSKLATPSLVIIFITGVIQLRRLDAGHLTDRTHGRILVFKVLLFAVAVFIGVATRQFVKSRLARAEVMTAPLAGRLRRAVGTEAAFGAAMLGLTAWMLATVPGNLVPTPRSSSDFAYQQVFKDTAGTVSLKVSVDPAKVGKNGVFVEVTKPVKGISSITITFQPPVNSTAHPVVMTITNLPGIGGAYLDQSTGIPLDVGGAWHVQVDLVAGAITLQQEEIMNVKSAAGATVPTLTPVTQPLVTAPA
ncbi:MAG TPA: CopD family protein, partial [Ilumatobacteraceae bacterium]